MNFILVCLHCLDMRDFHSQLRETPSLDALRGASVFVPMGRAQGHHAGDSLNAEMTGVWTARFCDSEITERGYRSPRRFGLPKTMIEVLAGAGYEIVTAIGDPTPALHLGSHAVKNGMREGWLRDQPERLAQFSTLGPMREASVEGFVARVLEVQERGRRFYAHLFLRDTHRFWGQLAELCALLGKPTQGWPMDVFCARKAALDRPDEFAALRRRGLARADRDVQRILEAARQIPDLTLLVYSNHGEVFDHFRHVLRYNNDGESLVEGTSHGNYPYEVLYANMQMWRIPGVAPRVMTGIGRSIDIAPTVLELAGVPHGPMDGESMLRCFAEGAFPERDRYAESFYGDGCVSMVRRDGFKFVSTGLERPEEKIGPLYHRLAVFDLRADPWEYVNLVSTPKGQEIVRWARETHRALKTPEPR
jgi:hypothetical protein